jgi:NADPH-dependent glutamate synthase beta subunit-like oxidoreductase
VVDALDYLKAFHLKQLDRPGKEVVVIGGGYTAMDAARTALRLGAKVHLVFRRSEAELPADPLELEAAREEGIQFHFLTAPTKLLARNNKVTGLECIRLEITASDTSGRKRVLPREGTEFILPADLVITAIGQTPDLKGLSAAGLSVSPWNNLMVHPETLQTNIPHIFAGGDVATGAASVVEAVAVGKKAAWAIDNFLTGHDARMPLAKPRLRLEKARLPEGEPAAVERPAMTLSPVSERRQGFEEAELGFSEQQAVVEARRCLRCDLTE